MGTVLNDPISERKWYHAVPMILTVHMILIPLGEGRP